MAIEDLRQNIEIKIESSRAGYLAVLDLRDDRKVHLLFPSQCARRTDAPRRRALVMSGATYGST